MTKPPDSTAVDAPDTRSSGEPAAAGSGFLTNRWSLELSSLLRELDGVSSADVSASPVISKEIDSRLALARLGTASSLFAALRCKHAATAAHALRVALSCSAWASEMGLAKDRRDVIEVAALLHDIGVIGLPDHILLKPGVLDSDETAVVTRSRYKGPEILCHSCSSPEILEIIEHVPAWYNGIRPGFRLQGERIPLGARMIAIAETFDAMTTDHAYRPAISHERATAELFDCAGAQFDPALVRQFVELHQYDQPEVHRAVAGRWLSSLDPDAADSYWQLNRTAPVPGLKERGLPFETSLLENMHDAVVFIDVAWEITLWNRGAERLTGIAGQTMLQQQWNPALLNMSDEKGVDIGNEDCPVSVAIRCGTQSLRRLTIWGRGERPVAVDAHAIPVVSENGATLGAILLFHDASPETSLEKRCQSLHKKATIDPLTKVANRAEFDRVLSLFVEAHKQQRVPCGLIIGDLDLFKQVNDIWGHQAGDDVLKCVASLIRGFCRPGDLVARYGGEEFVMLCADCGSAVCTGRAERIRRKLSEIPQPKMEGHSTTISFGVTEIQPGDTPDTMLRRADRALLMAKARGRNNVVQLGTGSPPAPVELRRKPGTGKPGCADHLIERVLVTPVPLNMAVEKLRGFVADHQARIISIHGNHVVLQITDRTPGRLRRFTDRPVTFRLDLRFKEKRYRKSENNPSSEILRTKIHLSIAPARNRDRRRGAAVNRAREMLISLQSYLIAAEEDALNPLSRSP